MARGKILLLFDVDGTLTAPVNAIKDEMKHFLLEKVLPRAVVGVVGGSDFAKISKQIGGREVVDRLDYVFAENGLIHYEKGSHVSSQSMVEFLGESRMQTFINFCLKYMSELTLPVKRGTFVEFRTGMLNVSPIGRSCSQRERDEFVKYDLAHGIRQTFVQAMEREFPDAGLKFSIGGQISIDVFPVGWDKTYCLRHLEHAGFDQIHFFGDRTAPGGNDYEIYKDARTVGHSVTSPDETKRLVEELLQLS